MSIIKLTGCSATHIFSFFAVKCFFSNFALYVEISEASFSAHIVARSRVGGHLRIAHRQPRFGVGGFLSADGDVSEQRNHTFVLYVLGLLELLMIVQNCVPVPMAIIFFLPVYVVIIMWKASRYLRIASGMTGRFVAGSVAGVLAPPYLLMLLMNIVLPS